MFQSNLAVRVVVAVAFIPVYLLLMVKGGLGLLILNMGVVLIATVELCRFGRPRLDTEIYPTALVAVATIYLMARGRPGDAASLAVIPFLVVLGLDVAAGRPSDTLLRASRASAAILYVAWLFGHVHLLRNPAPGLATWAVPAWKLAFIPFYLTWLVDTAAYGVGRAIGRTRLAPTVSPRKSWEGAAAGLLVGLSAGGTLAILAPLPILVGLALGGFVGTVGQVADLGESLLKREVGIKDSSRLIPGHGGMLDRFDSLLLNIPGVYYLLVIMAPGAS